MKLMSSLTLKYVLIFLKLYKHHSLSFKEGKKPAQQIKNCVLNLFCNSTWKWKVKESFNARLLLFTYPNENSKTLLLYYLEFEIHVHHNTTYSISKSRQMQIKNVSKLQNLDALCTYWNSNATIEIYKGGRCVRFI